jgi:mannose-1-phosphate guanylyltransferase
VQAVILVGGEGTRLRPLTVTVPKPVLPLVDRPFLVYMLEWLKRHGVDDVIMSCGFLATSVRNVLGDGSQFGLRLRFVEEPEPRGTAGALKYAEDLLEDRFLMLNGDVLTDIDLSAQMAQHEETGAIGTLALVPVEDPSAYGLVRTNEDRSVKEFVEKPTADSIDTNLISAGAYVLERKVLDLIPPDRNVSIEREIWPRLVGDGLFAFAGDAYWLAHVGSLVVLGEGVSVGEGSKIERSVVLNGTQIGPRCTLQDCIVAAGVRIGEGTVVSGGAVLGEGVTIGARNVLTRGVRVFPQTELPDGAITF